MDITEQLLEQVGDLTRRLNDIENNAKTNDELPSQSVFNPNSKIRVVVNGVSQITTLQRIIDAAVLAAMPFIDRFIVSNGFALSDNNLTVNSGWKWFLSGILYTNSTDSPINIPFTSADHSRIDLIVATTAGVFTRVTGVESLGTPVAPALPAETLQATFLTVTSDSISAPVEPVIGNGYVTKAEKQFSGFSGSGDIVNLNLAASANWELSGTIASIKGILEGDHYYGKEFILKNIQTTPIKLIHNSGDAECSFILLGAADRLLFPGESIRIVMNDDGDLLEIATSLSNKPTKFIEVGGSYTLQSEDSNYNLLLLDCSEILIPYGLPDDFQTSAFNNVGSNVILSGEVNILSQNVELRPRDRVLIKKIINEVDSDAYTLSYSYDNYPVYESSDTLDSVIQRSGEAFAPATFTNPSQHEYWSRVSHGEFFINSAGVVEMTFNYGGMIHRRLDVNSSVTLRGHLDVVPGNFHGILQIPFENGTLSTKEYADALITALLDGVPSAGNTLQKLYNLISGAGSEVAVADIAGRNAFNVPHLPFSIFVTDDGDGKWAKYQATSTGVGATFVKISDPDLLNAIMSAAAIKTAYESNSNTNALTNALLSKLNAIASGATANSSDAFLLARANQTGVQPASTISDFATVVLSAIYTNLLLSDTTDSSAVTGTTSNTLLGGPYTIPANTFASGDSFIVEWEGAKTNGNGTCTYGVYINSSPTLSGATKISGAAGSAGALNYLCLRHGKFTSASQFRILNTNTNNFHDFGSDSFPRTTINFDVTQQMYIMTAAILANGADIFTQTKFTLTRIKSKNSI